MIILALLQLQIHAGSVRQYLHDAWLNGITTWALIAGDYNTDYNKQVPIRYGYSGDEIPTDMYFAELHCNWNNGDRTYGNNTDYFPDIFVGRLICSNGQEITNWTNNVLKYEQNPGNNGDYSYLLKSFSSVAESNAG